MTEPSLFDIADQPAMPKPAKRDTLTEVAKRAMVARGIMDEHTGATRNARLSRCQNCKAPIIIGLCNPDFGTWAVELNPTALSAAGELDAIFAGRQRYRLIPHGGRWEIAARDIFTLRAEPAGTTREDICVNHICGESRFPFDPAVSNFDKSRIVVSAVLSDKPPF